MTGRIRKIPEEDVTMSFSCSDLLNKVSPPPIGEVIGWRQTAPADFPLIDLCQAVPNYPPAPGLVAYLKEIIDDPLTSRYSPDEGLPDVRSAIGARYERVYGAAVAPEEICLTVGASQAFWLALTTLCRAGDEVIVQTPAYFDHPMALQILGIKAVYTPYDPVNPGLPDPAVINSLISSRTRAILVVSPSNPTGRVTPPHILEELYRCAESNGIALILDETYADFIPSQPPHRIFSRPEWGDAFVHLMSFGKTYALTGYRAGLLAASRSLIREALKVQDTMVVCQPRITQQALLYGVTHLDSWVADNRSAMNRRQKLFCSLLEESKSPFHLEASGSFFAWVRHPFAGKPGREAARRLAGEYGILVLPGEVFGPGLEPFLRLALGNLADDAIPSAIERLCRVTA